ncbi:MAG: N-acetyltransferase [Anaerolineales bacterium]|nr:N-acetyltransferase [Anaerolineales bacterium]
MGTMIHETALLSENASIGEDTKIWHHAQVRNAVVGRNCVIGKGAYLDDDVTLGDNVKLQNYVLVYKGVHIQDGVFVGPHACFTNDMNPRAINPDGTLKDASDWQVSETHVHYGAAIGANSTIRCGVTIGKWALIGAGSVVTKDIPPYSLAYGNPARVVGFVCPCGEQLHDEIRPHVFRCSACGVDIDIKS